MDLVFGGVEGEVAYVEGTGVGEAFFTGWGGGAVGGGKGVVAVAGLFLILGTC